MTRRCECGRGFRVLLLLLLVTGHLLAPRAVGDTAVTPRAGDIVFRLDLTDPAVRARLEAQGAVVVNEGPSNTACLRVSNPAGAKPDKLVAIPFDITPYRGAKICFLALVRGEDVRASRPQAKLNSWDGAKFQTSYESLGQGKTWTDESKLQGTFAWREAGRIVGVATDAVNGTLNIGLGNAIGSEWVADVRIVMFQPAVTRPSATPNAADWHVATTRRGVMSPKAFREQDFDDLATWKANAMRWHMQGVSWKAQTYDQWLAEQLDDLARALDAARRTGIQMAVDLHDTPGGRRPDGTQVMFLDKSAQDRFVAVWEEIARRFKGHPALWAYDLVNEPVQNHPSPPGVDNWLALQVRTARAIRLIDPKTPIMIELDQWDAPESFAWLTPIPVSNIIYQAHMYWPGAFTHQGVFTDQGVAKDMNMEHAVTYPGVINGKVVDKEALRRHLAPVREFQLAYHVPIYIGEFSAARWAPGAAQYLDDCIAIFEEYGWDWTYHAFREWPGWSVEHADLPYGRTNHPVATQPTARMLVLKRWLARNAAGATSKAPAAAQQDAAHPVN